ncbi:hypothetical protein C2742_01660 [Polynucleobacter paneuropaeus]|uniref:lipid II flippase MurJ n=1 Tax=Polynucleobacter paneuropaeus TaxID=2527775 RepID=UPI001BFEB32C|nr:lipid II flippase MurJ [Polynucleobacter paneuropaeus]QWD48032.1 hypothetical protein G6658_01665 [Polynucleobacter paneuropaeus]QWD52908.1 hypothetical protein C2752_01660 [Polynucleobacter paneuropaeus]QWD57822.1 hypothetical protein C2742_01660 [Polynucleobacter paneuropaeus]
MILRSSLIVAGLALLGSFFGFLVQIELAREFGTGVQVDGYLFAISAPTFFAGMLAALLSYMVVPRIAKQNQQEQDRFIASLLFGAIAIAVALILLAPFFKIIQKSYLLNSTPISQWSGLDDLLRWGWWIAAIQIPFACLSAVLTGLRRPVSATALNLSPYLGMLVLLQLKQNGTVVLVAEGMFIGTAVSFLIALLILRARILLGWRHASWSEVGSLITQSPFMMIAMSCFSAYTVVDSYWAPRAGVGVLSTLGYAQRIIIGLGNLAVIGPSVVMAPRFAELVAKKDCRQFSLVLMKTFFVTGGLGFSLAISLFYFSEELISILFMRGAFDYLAMNQVANTLRYYLPGMIFMLLSVIGLRAICSFEGYEKVLAVLGIFWVFLYFGISALFFHQGATGLAIAYSISWIVYFVALCMILRRSINHNFFKKME